MNDFLIWLDGKKAYLLAIFSAINSFLVASNLYDANVGVLIQTILSIIAGGAKLHTDNAITYNTNLGVSIRNKRLNNLR